MHKDFIDRVRIHIKSGDGGSGIVHFKRERYIPKGGPDGGDGGKGGDIILVGDNQLNTLLHLKYKKHIKAQNGESGQRSNKVGISGKDTYINVPLGTEIKDDNDTLITEILSNGEKYIIAKGGKGGLGNTHFKTPINQAPRHAQEGQKGEEKNIILELKLLADVGLVGFPNAGKSTLLSSLSAARPKIADYPFTTLIPNIGVIKYYQDKTFVMADIPGIIENASQGKGLGTQFLRHIERNMILLIVIEAESDSIKKTFNILLNELQKYNDELITKKKLLAISKSDLLDNEIMKEIIQTDLPQDIDFVFFSSKTEMGLKELKKKIWELL